MGIYVFDFKKLEELLAANLDWVDFGKQIIPAAIERGNVQAFVFDDYWEDIGSISAFHAANLDMTATIPKFNFFNSAAPVYTRARYLPPSKINNSQIMQSNMSEGCIINRAHITRSVIGLRTRIDHGAHIEDSYLMGADWYQSLEEMRTEKAAGVPRVGIGEGAVIRNAIIDKNARIGRASASSTRRRSNGVRRAPTAASTPRGASSSCPKDATIPDAPGFRASAARCIIHSKAQRPQNLLRVPLRVSLRDSHLMGASASRTACAQLGRRLGAVCWVALRAVEEPPPAVDVAVAGAHDEVGALDAHLDLRRSDACDCFEG